MIDWDLLGLRAAYGGPHGPWLRLMVAVTVAGGGWAALLVLPLLAWTPTRRIAWALVLAVTAQASLVWALKRVVARVRPWIALGWPAPWGTPSDFSFPSGHAAGSFCVAVFLAVALPAVRPSWGRRTHLATGLLVFFAFIVAFSRVYLGAHFPSDVAAGAIVGSVVGGAAGRAYARAVSGAPRPGWNR